MSEKKAESSKSRLVKCDSQRILIADDEPELCEMFRVVLSHELDPCRVDVVKDGTEAVEAFRQDHHAVLLLDIHMPVMNGLNTYREIRKICHAGNWVLPACIFCTGFELPRDIENIVSAHPKHCALFKPVSNDTLVDAVRLRLEML